MNKKKCTSLIVQRHMTQNKIDKEIMTRKSNTNNSKKLHIAICLKMVVETQRHMTQNRIK